jgi:hypothetical protein
MISSSLFFCAKFHKNGKNKNKNGIPCCYILIFLKKILEISIIKIKFSLHLDLDFSFMAFV